jgi:hypothetical protein
MGKVLNFWSEDEALDAFYFIKDEWTYETFCEYLKDYAPWLLKRSKELWLKENA